RRVSRRGRGITTSRSPRSRPRKRSVRWTRATARWSPRRTNWRFPMADASHIYAGVAGYFGKPDHTGKSGVFQRAAKGGTWKHVLGNLEAYTVFVKPDNPEVVFAGTNDGVWRSTDRGGTFKRTAFPDKTQVWSFMVDR